MIYETLALARELARVLSSVHELLDASGVEEVESTLAGELKCAVKDAERATKRILGFSGFGYTEAAHSLYEGSAGGDRGESEGSGGGGN